MESYREEAGKPSRSGASQKTGCDQYLLFPGAGNPTGKSVATSLTHAQL